MSADVPAGLMQRLRWWLQAAPLAFIWWLGRRLSPRHAAALGGTVLSWLGPRSGKQRHVVQNLAIAVPGKTSPEYAALAREVWSSIGQTLAEYPHLAGLADWSGSAPAVEIVSNLEGVMPDRGPVIFVSAHLANWELALATVRQLGFKVDAIYNPQKNPRLERLVQCHREALDCRFYPTDNAVRRMYKSLREGRSVALLVDFRGDGGELLPFFGREALTTTAPAWLAEQTACPVVPVQMERLEYACYRATVAGPLAMISDTGVSKAERIRLNTVRINHAIEAMIREHPGQWLCTKRRWPKRPGKP